MEIVTVDGTCRAVARDSAVTIGNFDGVHCGHMALFRQLKDHASRRGLQSLAVTFEPHPLKVLSAETAPPLITTFEQKAALIGSAGIDCLAVIPFTSGFAAMEPNPFVHDILCTSLGMRHIVIGHDYAFGRGRAGNYETLERIGAEAGFTVEYVDPVGEEELIFSSSLARRLIASGDMGGASRVLGRYHMISGTVVHGREMGQRIGYPTANVASGNELLPPDGVYAVMASVGGRLAGGACNIGSNPTFDGNTRSVEVFLLDFSERIYGRALSLWFVHRLRDVVRFADPAALVDAITLDVKQTREMLATVDTKKIQPDLPA